MKAKYKNEKKKACTENVKFCIHYHTSVHGRTDIFFQKDTILIYSEIEEKFMGMTTPATDENKKSLTI